MPALKIKDSIYWVGVVDWSLRNFHGYSLARKGTTYNAYLVKDKKTTLIDTVDNHYLETFLKNIESVAGLAEIDYMIVNHVEPDHSGCLERLVDLVKPKKIFCSAMGKAFMISHYHHEDWPYEVVKTGDAVSLGRKTVRFIELKMLHWPDNMGCYFEDDALLISSDAFGHNWATGERFDDQVDFEEIRRHLAHYFANIILPFSPQVLQTLQNIQDLDWKINMIAPSHGLIFRSHADKVIKAYGEFARQEGKGKAVIVYDTMWKSTERMAYAVADGLNEEGVSVKVFNMKACHHSDVMAEVLDAKAVLFGSPTHNNGVLPLIADMLRYMEGLRPQGKIGAAFGSYGWSGESVKHLTKGLESMDMTVIGSLKVKNIPTEAALIQCVELGKTVGEAVHKQLKKEE